MGVDIWAAQIVLKNKSVFSDLHLICAIPFPGFGDRWPSQWYDAYREIIAQADLVKNISPAFSYASFQRRNKWMVDHSGRVIAVYNGCSGGTRNTMAQMSELLSEAINSIMDAKEESDIDSLFRNGGTSALLSEVSGIDDFELICFLVVK